jgi:hypothetical protein
MKVVGRATEASELRNQDECLDSVKIDLHERLQLMLNQH